MKIKESEFYLIPNYSAYRINKKWQVITYFKRIKIKGEKGTTTILLDKPHRILKNYVNQDGYECVYLKRDDGHKQQILIHHLMLWAHGFPKPFKKAVGRHLDGNPLNNAIENLKWGTMRENADDTVKHGRLKGHLNPASRLKPEDVVYIRNHKTTYIPDLMKKFNVSRGVIDGIRANKTYRNV